MRNKFPGVVDSTVLQQFSASSGERAIGSDDKIELTLKCEIIWVSLNFACAALIDRSNTVAIIHADIGIVVSCFHKQVVKSVSANAPYSFILKVKERQLFNIMICGSHVNAIWLCE